MTSVQPNNINTQKNSPQQQNIEIVRRFYEEVFNQGREKVIDEIIAPNYMDYGHNPPGRGIEGAKQDFHSGSGIFSDVHFKMDDTIATEDRVVVRWTGTLTHIGEFMGIAPTGKTVKLTGISMYRLANGKITETQNAVNWLNMLQELGATIASYS